MRQQIVFEERHCEDCESTTASFFALLNKRVCVSFDDSTRRYARLTKLIGHEIKVNGRGCKYILDSIELDNDGSELSSVQRIVSIDNIEKEIG